LLKSSPEIYFLKNKKTAFRFLFTKWQLYALQSTGKRLKEIPFAYKNGKINFKAQTGIFKNEAVFAYELIRQ
jgi:hypothetical protein